MEVAQEGAAVLAQGIANGFLDELAAALARFRVGRFGGGFEMARGRFAPGDSMPCAGADVVGGAGGVVRGNVQSPWLIVWQSSDGLGQDGVRPGAN